MCKLGLASTPSSVVKIETAFCAGGFATACTINNGNVMMDRITAPGMTVSRGYLYDSANRLTRAGEYNLMTPPVSPGCPDAGSVWCESFGYDSFGNRSITGRTGLTAPQNEPVTFDVTSNRVTGSGWTYDETGNLTQDGALMALTYDGENRQVGGAGWSYGYDGAGHRVRSTDGLGNVTTFVYGADGQIAAEYGPVVAGATAGRVYVTGDHLGSTRVVTDGTTAGVKERLDYLPFGETLNVPSGSPRVGVLGYVPAVDVLRQKFTGKERDAETGLDYFGARYYSGVQGRWTSPDWSASPQPVPYADLGDPQTLNLYGYVRNNPLVHDDPDGHRNPLVATGEFFETVPSPFVQAAGGALILVGGLLSTDSGRKAAADLMANAGGGGGQYGDFSKQVKLPQQDQSYMMQQQKDLNDKGQAKPPSNEPPQLKAGKEAHKAEAVRPGEKAEVLTPSGKRMDRYDEDKAHIREIKPDNARQRRAGAKQLEGYKAEMDADKRKSHTTELTVYPKKK